MRGKFFSIFSVAFLLFPSIANVSPLRNKAQTEEVAEFTNFDDDTECSFDDFFKRLNKLGVFNGNVLIYNNGKVFTGSYGNKQIGRSNPLDINTAFQLASVSKPLTSATLLTLVDKGLINLDDSLQKFFPKLHYKGITVEMLLSHKSGLPEYMYFTSGKWKQNVPMTNKNLVDFMVINKPLIAFKAGTRFDYCNTNYALLAAIAEEVTGKPFETILLENVITPSKMSHTFCQTKVQSDENCAFGHRGAVLATTNFQEGILGDKGTYSTIYDLLKFNLALNQGVLFSKELSAKMETPQHSNIKTGSNYGFGWRIVNDNPEVIYHKGWWNGYKTNFFRHPTKNICVVILSNSTKVFAFNPAETINWVDKLTPMANALAEEVE
jgi:CubicO group peptidase (beta-lactamase class C family)